MTSISWKLNRVRAMSAPEIGHRAVRAVQMRIEKACVSLGWQPRPKQPIGHKNSLFSNVDGWETVWNQSFSLDHEKLDGLIDGQIDVFTYPELQFGRPIDWHRDPLTGQTSPLIFGKTLDYRDDSQVGDVKVLWELGRHQHLISLAAAYACSGMDSYKDAVVEQIDGWIDCNPFAMGIHWSSSLECGLRLISWAMVHSFLVLRGHGQGLFSVVSNPDKLGRAIYQHAWFIRRHLSRFSSANNHLIGELSGLWVANQVFDLGAVGERWGQLARNEIETQARVQVHSDGVDREQAIYYHLWVLEYLLVVWLIGERNKQPFSKTFRDRILSMSSFLQDISLDNGEPPQIGDADDGFVTRFEPSWPVAPYEEVQCTVDAVLRKRQQSHSRELPQKAFWYGLIAGILPNDVRDPPSANKRDYPILYKEGGYAILGDEHIRIVFDAGPLGYPSIAAHGHADALSFCLALDNEWWLIDPGTYAYHREAEWRDYFRGTSAHNTVEIDGLNQSKIGGAFLWLEQANARFEASGKTNGDTQFVRAMHDGYRSVGVTHYRELEYRPTKRTIEITDRISRERTSGSLRISSYFHFASDVQLVIQDSSCLATKSGSKYGLRFHLDSNCRWEIAKGQTNPIQGWYSPRLGSKLPAPVLVGKQHGPSRLEIATRIDVSSAKLHG